MRILLVTNGLRYGGAERVVEALAVDLTARGDTVKVIATTRDGPIGESLRERGIHTSVLHIGSQVDARVPMKLALVAREFRPDVVHSHLAVADIATAGAAATLRRCRFVSTVHNPGVQLDRFKKTLWRRALRAFDVVTAVSERVRATLDAELNPIVLRPSLVEASDTPLSRADARRRLGLPLDAPVVMAVGRLDPIKGFDVLADAAQRIADRGVRFVVIGDGEERVRLEGTKLELLGARDDAADVLTAADIVVCPSRSEGFPQIPIHAMAVRRPVVASDVGGMGEIVVHGETGTLVPPETPEVLAAAIGELLDAPERASEMGAAGADRLAVEGFTRSAMVLRTRALYEA